MASDSPLSLVSEAVWLVGVDLCIYTPTPVPLCSLHTDSLTFASKYHVEPTKINAYEYGSFFSPCGRVAVEGVQRELWS
jgi:hypothetical protein